MTSENSTDLLRRMASQHHRPPEVPREVIWSAIQEQRTGNRTESLVRPPARWWRLVWWPAAAVAALIFGIIIGRAWFPQEIQPPVAQTESAESNEQDAAALYRRAAQPYLNRAEALLTQFRVDAAVGDCDEQISDWARGLLTETRLLMDSPAAADPEFSLLLGDLEMALAQIALLAARQHTREPQWINRGLDRRAVLSRLRARIPAGSAVTSI